MNKPIIIAHRGASGYEPENTLRSFKRALEMGAPMIELDVFLSKDGKVVVIHDETINRTTNGKGYVNDFSWNELKKFNAGKDEHIPLLSEVFDLIDKKITIDIEIKDLRATIPVANLINYYINHKNWSANNFIVSSFDYNVIYDIKHYLPQVKTGIIFKDTKNNPIKITQQADAQIIILNYINITQDIINQAHDNNLLIFAYTVNDRKFAEQLAEMQIDGIITDCPDILE